jgi:putative membrane protein
VGDNAAIPFEEPAMLASPFVAFLHFVAAFGIVATVFFEWLTFSRNPTYLDARRIQLADRWYGIFAGVVLIVGFLRVFYFEKGSDFYFSSPFFLLKLALFVIAGVLSIYPTMKFIAWGKDTRQNRAPVISEKDYATISLVLKIEVGLLLGIMLSASLMARGVLH